MTTKAYGDSDAQLVEWTLAGDRTAFATIVKRYQSLVCSITYNATGSLSLSEDLAQETFLAAWRQLSELREPARLRSWLCGITRFLVGKEYRRRGREPLHAAESLDAIQEPNSLEASPATQAVSREEEAILWRALERIPDTYREPLILFYREEKSIERVAAELELSEDAVKQRLSRGRKLLHEEVIAFVEGTLSRTAPGQDFSNAVLAMLPIVPAATVGTGMAGKGATLVKSGSVAAWLAPFLGVVAGILAIWLSSGAAPTARERRFRRFLFFGMLIFSLVWSVAGQFAIRTLRQEYAWSYQTFLWVMTGFWMFYSIVAAAYVISFKRGVKSLRRQIEQEPGKPEATGTPLTFRSILVVLICIYVASFSWLVCLALRANDRLGAAVIGGIMADLFMWHLLEARRRAALAPFQGATGRVAFAWAIILVILNLRLQVWLAALSGISLIEMHRLLPVWVVPSATLFLVLLVGLATAPSRSQNSISGSGKQNVFSGVEMTLQGPIVAILICMLAVPQPAVGADISPNKWKPEEKAQAEKAEMVPWPSQARVVQGQSGLVAATMSPVAVHAGVEALRQGGTAADAAATVALTQITTALGSYVSYGGILQLVYYDAKSGKVSTLNAGWGSYLGETDPKSIPVDDLGPLAFGTKPTEGAEGRKTLVPGFMAGIEQLHKRFGRLPFRELFQPAIWYAENGITISPTLGKFFSSREKYLSRTAEGRAFMNQAGDGLPKPGDRFVQAELAKTLRAVARSGSSYMYTGAWGEQFVQAVQRQGGKATMEDMKRYRPIWEEPQSTTFLGHTVFVPGKSNSGGSQVLEALNLAEELKLDQMGPYQKDPKAFRALSRILRKVESDSYVAEYYRSSSLPDDRITKAYAKAQASALDEVRDPPQPEDTHHSDSVIVVDRWGNVAALVHSINTVLWGTTGIVVGGIPISDAAGFQQARLAAIKPGDLVPQDEEPAIAMAGARPVLAVASVGASLIPETVRFLVGTLANHLDPLAVMAAPPLLVNNQPAKADESFSTKPELVPEGAYDSEFLQYLRALGVNTEQKSKQEAITLKGTAVLGTIDPQSGVLRSAETPGVFGFAAAY
jgi:gamma-glutamyltranspeptidase/glutathione hydrolase